MLNRSENILTFIEYLENRKDLLSYYKFIKKNSTNDVEVLDKLEQFYSYCINNQKRKSAIVISVHGISISGNVCQALAKDIMHNCLSEFYFGVSKCSIYEQSVDTLCMSPISPLSIMESYDKQIINIFGIENLFEKDKKEKENFFMNIETLMSNNCAIFISSSKKENLEMFFSQSGIIGDFSFDFSTDSTFEQIESIVYSILTSKNFSFEPNWESYLHTYIQRSKEKMDYALCLRLCEKLQKEYRKTSLNDNKIKNSFFGVKILGVDVKIEDLKGLAKLNKLVGMEEIKEKIKQLIAYLGFNEKLKQKTGKSYPLNLHMLFTGSPGTGKTTIARVIAEILFELNYIKENKLIEVDKKDLVSQWVGHTSIKTNEVIEKAIGGVLFIDEAYSINDDKFGKDAIATLIKAMEDRKSELVVVFAGYEKEMDDFIKSNPGIKSRIGHHIFFDDYSVEELIEIYRRKLEAYNISSEDKVFEKLGKIISVVREQQNFGNGRFIDNLIQQILFEHSINIGDLNDDYHVLTILEKDLPEKYLELIA